MSIDSVDPGIYAKIRLKGELARVLRTLEDLRSYRDSREQEGRGFRLRMEMVVQVQNHSGVEDFLQYARERDIQPGLAFCYEPPEHSLLSLEAGERRKILQSYEELFQKTNEATLMHLISPLRESFDKKKRFDWFIRQVRNQGYY